MMFLSFELPLYYTEKKKNENTYECHITYNVIIVCCIYSFSRHILKTCQSLFILKGTVFIVVEKYSCYISDDIVEQQLLPSVCQTLYMQYLVYLHNNPVRLG